MKIEITKKYIIITPAPKKNKKNGLKVHFWKNEKTGNVLPFATTDIIKGQRKYMIPPEFKFSIKCIEF